MRRWWKWLGLAALAGVVGAGVAVQRSRRTWTTMDSAALRARLHQRLAEAEGQPAGANIDT